MRNTLRLVLDRQTNQLVVVPHLRPLPRGTGEAGWGASVDAQCRKAHHDAFTKARQNGRSFPVAWAIADKAARGLREQLTLQHNTVHA